MAGKFKLLSFLSLVVACLAHEPLLTTPGSVGPSAMRAPSATKTRISVNSSSTPTPFSTKTRSSVGSSTTRSPSATKTPGPVGSPATPAPSATTIPGPVGSPATPAPSPTTIPGLVGSSATPALSSTTAAPDLVGSSTTLAPSATTPDSVGSSRTPAPSSTAAPGPCDINQCGQGSTCAVRANQTFVCLCLPGDNYNYVSKTCENAKVFPGQLALPGLPYDKKMRDKESLEFKEAAQKITAELTTIFNTSDGYSNSTVLELQEIEQRKVESRSGNGVSASVEIIFNKNSKIKTTEIQKKMVDASGREGLLQGASFKEKNLCSNNPCDERTTNCTSENGSYKCPCRENFIRTDFSGRICIACPSGQQAQDSLTCVSCPFGYSGLNCNESWQLALVITGSVLGGLLLIALILLPVLTLKSSKWSSKKDRNADIGKPYVSHSPAKSPLVNSNSSLANNQAPSLNGSNFGGVGVPRIPRATTTSNWGSRTNLEMAPSNSRQNLIPVSRNLIYDDQDDMNPYAQSRPQSSLHAQGRSQNPYAQSRPQVNPYARSQGQTNPYYMQDRERWLNE
ncbi:mucin-13b [Xiphias gladius]|uniref:mucin-13b n=1 Tax=Xiphias gladius TaxID=8245 RepID=UPI001A99F6AF|nr:mucin-13b [Xiphias gladius]